MKKVLAAALLFALFTCPAFAAKKSHTHHQHYNYHYKTPKYKAPKARHHQSHPHNARKSQSN
jgi:hypothetical protein